MAYTKKGSVYYPFNMKIKERKFYTDYYFATTAKMKTNSDKIKE